MFKHLSDNSKIRNAGLILLLILISFGVFYNSLENSFVWDDTRYILDHPFIEKWSNIKYLFSATYFQDPQKMLSLGMYNVARPVWVISAMVDYKIWGFNPLGHHLTNLILHSLSVVLLFVLLNLIFKNYYLSFLASLIFALHPIHTETVNVVTFRTDMLALVFMILAFIVFIKALGTKGLRSLIAIICSVVFYIIANFAKGMAITLPVLLGLYLYLLVPKEKLAKNKKAIYLYFSLIGLIAIAYLFLRRTHFFYGTPDIAIPLGETNLLYRLGVMSAVFTNYLRLLFLPIGLCADYSFSLPPSMLSPGVILGACLLASIFIYALIFRKKQSLISFTIFWFFVTLFPVSNIIPMVNIIAERYLYIPSIGFCIFFAFIFLKLRNFPSKLCFRRAINLLFIFILGFYALGTIKRNQDWKDNLTIWSKTVRQSPDNFRVRNNLGKAYGMTGRINEAIGEFERSLKINPQGFIAHANLGACYQKLGRFDEAKSEYRKALRIKPTEGRAIRKLWIVHVGLGNDYLKVGRLDEAMQEYLAAVALKPEFAPVYYNLGNIFLKRGMLKEAKEMYLRTIEINKYYAEAYGNLGVIFAKQGDLEKAEQEWRKALKFKPNLSSVKENLNRLEREEE